MTILDSLKVILDGDTSGLSSSFFKAVKSTQKLENQLDAFDKALKKAEKDMDGAAGAAKKFAAAQDQAAKSSQNFGKWVKGTATEINSVMSILGRIGGVAKDAFKLMEDSARTSTAKAFFEASGKSIDDFRDATKGLVSDADLIKKSNLAETMGITAEQFKVLATVAQASAAKTGQSMSHMLDSIIIGTARESRLLLDNLGIIIDVTKAREAYVEKLRQEGQLGDLAKESNAKLATQLTDTAEKMAFMTAALEAGAPVLEQYKKIGGGAAENFDRFKTNVDNLKESLGSAFLTVFDTAISKIGEFLGTLAEMDDQSLMILIGTLGFAGLSEDFWKQTKLRDDPSATTTPGEQQIMLLKELEKRGVSFADAIGKTEGTLEYERKKLEEWGAEITGMIARFRELNKITKQFAEPAAKSGKSPFKPKEVDPEKEAAKQKRVDDFLQDFDRKMDEFDQEMMRIKEDILVHGGGLPDVLKKIREELEESYEAYVTMRSDQKTADFLREVEYQKAIDDEARERAKAEEEKTAGILGQTGGLLSAAMSGSASALGSAIGGFFGPVGEAIGSIVGELLEPLQPVINILGQLAAGIINLLQIGFNPLLETLEPLGPALYELLTAVGVLIASALNPFLPVMKLLVGIVVLVVRVIAGIITVLSPFVEILVGVLGAIITVFGTLFEVFEIFAGDRSTNALHNFLVALDGLGKTIIDIAIIINNAIVEFVRGLGEWSENTFGTDFGLAGFGQILTRDDFEMDIETTENNTDATRENTRAVENLSREIRNLPQGYKINYAFYNATDPVTQYPRLTIPDGLRNPRGSNFRFRL
jgi:hypothetical protein